jgi:hypothetical protein
MPDQDHPLMTLTARRELATKRESHAHLPRSDYQRGFELDPMQVDLHVGLC